MFRRYTKSEQLVLARLVLGVTKASFPGYTLANLFDEILGNNVCYDAANKSLFFGFESTKAIDPNKIIDISGKILEKALLLLELEKEGYISLIKDNNITGRIAPFGKIDKKCKAEVSYTVPDKVADILEKHYYIVYISEALRSFVLTDNFVTFEEKQTILANKQIKKASKSVKTAVAAALISILTFLGSIGFQYWSNLNLSGYYQQVLDLCTQIANNDCCSEEMLSTLSAEIKEEQKAILEIEAKLEPQIVTKYITRYKTKYVNQPATYKVACGDSLELIQVKK